MDKEILLDDKELAYSRSAEVEYSAFEICNKCGEFQKRLVSFDTSGGEYGAVQICFSCLQTIYEDGLKRDWPKAKTFKCKICQEEYEAEEEKFCCSYLCLRNRVASRNNPDDESYGYPKRPESLRSAWEKVKEDPDAPSEIYALITKWENTQNLSEEEITILVDYAPFKHKQSSLKLGVAPAGKQNIYGLDELGNWELGKDE